MRPERAGACLRCLWPEATRDGLVGNCAEAGVLGPVPGVFGSLQASRPWKLLLDLPGQLGDELLVMDLTQLTISRVRARRSGESPPGRCPRAAAALQQAQSRSEASAHAADGGAAAPLELQFATPMRPARPATRSSTSARRTRSRRSRRRRAACTTCRCWSSCRAHRCPRPGATCWCARAACAARARAGAARAGRRHGQLLRGGVEGGRRRATSTR
ncbi:MAG: hypothetical protein U1F11_03960 [Steroidobacteraceae bacterium]